jgi:hypothetical protein
MLWSDVKKMTARCLRLPVRDLYRQTTGAGSRMIGAGDLPVIASTDRSYLRDSSACSRFGCPAITPMIVDRSSTRSRRADVAAQWMLANL